MLTCKAQSRQRSAKAAGRGRSVNSMSRMRSESMRAGALRLGAHAHPGRYTALQTVPTPDEDLAHGASNAFVAALSTALRAYRLDGDDFTHAVRFIRSTVHGFIALELAGGFRREQSVDSSYQLAILALHRVLTAWPPTTGEVVWAGGTHRAEGSGI